MRLWKPASCAILAVLALLIDNSPAASKPLGQQCPSIPNFIAQMDAVVPDLGEGELIDESETTVEALGSKECPKAAATQCEKLTYMAFMLSLMDMSPSTYRRPGIAAFLANIMEEDSSFGTQCSAERIGHSPKSFRASFSKPFRAYFCAPTGAGYATATAAGIFDTGGTCGPEDGTLTRVNAQIISENAGAFTLRPEYKAGLGALVTRLYRYKFKLPSDEEAFGFRGRGFIQITGRASYQDCQNDILYARAYLSKNIALSQRVMRRTAVDWSRLDVTVSPSEVSHNLYVAAFCAASYWNHRVARDELVWPKATASSTFKRLALAVNTDETKAEKRIAGFTKWCQTARCASNAPQNLRVDLAFGQLVGQRTGPR